MALCCLEIEVCLCGTRVSGAVQHELGIGNMLHVGLFINSSGMATAIATGSATISASAEGVSGSTTVSVTTSPLNSIQVTPQNPSLTVAQGSQQFSAIGFFSDGTVQDITSSVTWTSSDKAVVTINKTGLASVAKAGTEPAPAGVDHHLMAEACTAD